MPTIYDLKPRFQALLRPLASGLVARGATANQVTIAAFVLSLAGGAAILLWPEQRWPWLALPAILFLRMALNALDGMMAREHGQASPLGAILNEAGDVLSDSALYLPFAALSGASAWLVVAVVFLAVLGEFVGVVAVQIGASRRYDGPFGKSDRAFAFGFLAVLVGLGVAPGRYLDGIFLVFAALGLLTVVNRARRALAEAAP